MTTSSKYGRYASNVAFLSNTRLGDIGMVVDIALGKIERSVVLQERMEDMNVTEIGLRFGILAFAVAVGSVLLLSSISLWLWISVVYRRG